MFAYCNNNPVSRADSKGEFFNTVCGAFVGGAIAALTCTDKENRGVAFLRGFTTGGIAGAALDISIVTAGTGTAIAIATAGGALAATADYVWEQSNKKEDITLGGVVTNATIGAGLNALFMGAGRVANRHVGNTLASAGKALWDNTVKSVTSRASNFMINKFGSAVLENTVSSVIQGTFGKIYSFVADQIGVY